MARVVVTRDDRIAKTIADVFRYIDREALIRDRVVAAKPNETWGFSQGQNWRHAARHFTRGASPPQTVCAARADVKLNDGIQLALSSGPRSA